MLSFGIGELQLKTFMRKLLREDCFDNFEMRSAEVYALARFEIQGILDKNFLPAPLPHDFSRIYCTWGEVRDYVFNIIKGNKRPKYMKIVLSLPTGEIMEIHPNAAACFLNISFESDDVICTVSSSEKIFTMDKSVDSKWEEYITEFMKRIGILISTR